MIRHCLKLKFHPDPARPAKTSVDSRGRKMLEEWGWVGKVTDKRRMYVRRITLDRIGEESIIVLTNLLDEASARPSVGASLGSYHKPTAKTHKVAGGHSSAWKLLEQARKKKQSAERANK